MYPIFLDKSLSKEFYNLRNIFFKCNSFRLRNPCITDVILGSKRELANTGLVINYCEFNRKVMLEIIKNGIHHRQKT